MILPGHNNPPLTTKEIIEKNINRKKPILDRDPQFHNGVPLPSWIELSLIDVCNRTCSFCPKSDLNIAPDTYNKMEMPLINKLAKDLQKINFEGYFSFCGYGEPLLHPNINKIIEILGKNWGIEIVTNGDPLNEENLVTTFKSNKLVSSFDYFNQNVGSLKSSYISNKTTLSVNENNSLSFSTRKNKTKDLTEYYNFMYQYKNDCLAASIEYDKNFYNDNDVQQNENLIFKLTIIPLGQTSSPNFKN